MKKKKRILTRINVDTPIRIRHEFEVLATRSYYPLRETRLYSTSYKKKFFVNPLLKIINGFDGLLP